MAKKWIGPLPQKCDLCALPLKGKVFYDANLGGVWGIVDEECFKERQARLGTGLGQKYNADGTKIEG